MLSSIFPNTITILNFKSVFSSVEEFWKRYHQSVQKRYKSFRIK
jgi:hypothetical protein